MPQDQVLLSILGVLVLANIVLLASLLLGTRRQRRSWQHQRLQHSGRPGPMDTPIVRTPADEPGAPPVVPARGDPRADDDPRAAAAIEAFIADVSADAAGRARPPAPSEVIAFRREIVIADAPTSTPIPLRAGDRANANDSLGAPEWTPAALADHGTWNRGLREESARLARFGRPVTVVIAELPHLDDVTDRLGRDVADRVVTETARLLVTDGRAADRLAWLGYARFGVLLLETEEKAACRYVDRLRAAVDGWLESAGLSVRLSLGWASPEGGDVMAAAVVAQQRMHDADRR
jgi:diguanylate cyclase (GGDEF)-like protein